MSEILQIMPVIWFPVIAMGTVAGIMLFLIWSSGRLPYEEDAHPILTCLVFIAISTIICFVIFAHMTLNNPFQ